MAIKAGGFSPLRVPQPTLNAASRFLDSVQSENGAFYGYTGPGQGLGTTAIGLLCRMSLGWPQDRAELAKGIKCLADQGPKRGNSYFNYYATQALYQFDGPDGGLWREWDAKMTDQLLSSQGVDGHETGSWFFAGGDDGAKAGGRLYCTAMTAATLEVYYRYPRIYAD